MKVLRISIVVLFLAKLSSAACAAGQGTDKDGSQGTGTTPECDLISAPGQL
jgi:hypothetical protein